MTQPAFAQRIDREVGLAIDQLPLSTIDFEAEVRGLHVACYVTQTFENKLDKSLEAIYVFPLVPQASVLGTKLTIGNRTIEAELRTREDAQKKYAEARDQGHHAAMVEQERPYIFTMSVAGIEPGEKISVKVHYIAPVDWQDDGGRLQIPLVVAPRFVPGFATGYSGGGASPDTDQVPDASRVTPKQTVAVNYKASLKLSLTPGFEAEIASPSHTMLMSEHMLAEGETHKLVLSDLRPDRDIVVTYKTRSPLPTIGVEYELFSTPSGETDHLVLVQIAAGCVEEESEKPLDVALLLDRSGSMDGVKLDGLKKIAKKVLTRLGKMNRAVRVAIWQFDNDCKRLADISPLTDMHYDALDRIQSGGSTFTCAALNMVTQALNAEDNDHEKCIILVCDGHSHDAGYRPVKGIRVHSVGIDAAVNNALMQDFAKQTEGSCEWILPGEDYDAAAARVTGMASGPVLRNLELRGLPKKARVVNLGDCYHAQPRTIGILTAEPIDGFGIVGLGPDGKQYERAIRVPQNTTSALVAPLYGKMLLGDLRDKAVKTETSLRYGVLCNSTAFIAVSKKEIPGEKPETIDIPVLTPHGWEYDDHAHDIMSVRRLCQGAAGAGAPATRGVTRRSVDAPARRRRAGGSRKSKLTRGSATRGGGTSEPQRYRSAGFENFAGGGADHLGEVSEIDAIDYDSMLGGDPPTAEEQSAQIPPTGLDVHETVRSMLDAANTGSILDLKNGFEQLKVTVHEAALNNFDGWSDGQKSTLLLLIAKLAQIGMLIRPIPVTLLKEPAGEFAKANWREAKKLLGLA